MQSLIYNNPNDILDNFVVNTGNSFTDLSFNHNVSTHVTEVTWTAFSRLGTDDGLSFNGALNTADIDITQFDGIALANNGSVFKSFAGSITATDAPILSSNANWMFQYSSASNLNIGHWDTSSVTTMSLMFDGASQFNTDISAWDVANVTTMNHMFRYASSFNSIISNWDVSSATNLSYMFQGAAQFNQDLNWNVTLVTNMDYMFQGATQFNSDISNWNLNTTSLSVSAMFSAASQFNSDISAWNIGGITSLTSMFYNATSFNSDISAWNVANVTIMDYLFYNATSFNSDISAWNVANVTAFGLTFTGAKSFNSDISAWNVAKAMKTNLMFSGATSFNSDISAWNVANVRDMNRMFYNATSFNSDISAWNVANAGNMQMMFFEATSFNYSIGSWDLTNVTNASQLFVNAGLDYNTYSSMLQEMQNSNTIADNLDFGVLGFYRIDDTATNDAVSYLSAKGITLNDGGAFNVTQLERMHNIVYPKIVMTNDVSGLSTTIDQATPYTIITDSGNLRQYNTNENINHSFVFENALSMFVYNITESSDVLKIYDNSGNELYNFSGVNSQTIDISELTGIDVQFTSNATLNSSGYIIILEMASALTANICFRKGTPILTDQGLIEINKLDTNKHTIRNKQIKCITETISKHSKLVCVTKDALFEDCPCQDTVMSMEHCIFYKGKLQQIKNFVNDDTIIYIDNNNEILYNVLLKDGNGLMLVNGMIAETLSPDNLLSHFYSDSLKMDNIQKSKYFKEVNYQLAKRELYATSIII